MVMYINCLWYLLSEHFLHSVVTSRQHCPTQDCRFILHRLSVHLMLASNESVSNLSAVVKCRNSSGTSSMSGFKYYTITDICSFLLTSLVSSTKRKNAQRRSPHHLCLFISYQPSQKISHFECHGECIWHLMNH